MIQQRQAGAVMLVTVALMTTVAVVSASAEAMSVQVKEAPLRDAPSFVGKVVGTLVYGDRVEVQETKGAWSKVAGSGAAGWMHGSALSAKKIVLTAGQAQAQTAASGDELALAGKGFNSDVESQFKLAHKDIDFTWIDRMEKIRIPATEMQSFLKKGGITPGQGGSK